MAMLPTRARPGMIILTPELDGSNPVVVGAAGTVAPLLLPLVPVERVVLVVVELEYLVLEVPVVSGILVVGAVVKGTSGMTAGTEGWIAWALV